MNQEIKKIVDILELELATNIQKLRNRLNNQIILLESQDYEECKRINPSMNISKEKYEEYRIKQEIKWRQMLTQTTIASKCSAILEDFKTNDNSAPMKEKQIEWLKQLNLYSGDFEFEKRKEIISQAAQILLQKYQKNLEQIKALYETKTKIKYQEKRKQVDGIIKGYQLVSNIKGEEPMVFPSKDSMLHFIKSNPQYYFDKYVIMKSSLITTVKTVDATQVQNRKKVNAVKKVVKWVPDFAAQIKDIDIPKLVRKKKIELNQEKWKRPRPHLESKKENTVPKKKYTLEEFIQLANYLHEGIRLKGYEKASNIEWVSISDIKGNTIVSKQDYLEKIKNGFIPEKILLIITNPTRETSYPKEITVKEFLNNIQIPKKEIKHITTKPNEEKIKVSKEQQPRENPKEKYLKLLNLIGKKLDLSSLGIKSGYLNSLVFVNEKGKQFYEGPIDSQKYINENNFPIALRIQWGEKDKVANRTIPIDDIDSILSLPVLETKIPTEELEVYKKLLQLHRTMNIPGVYLKGMGTQLIGAGRFTMENGITENYYSIVKEFIDEGIRPISLSLYNHFTEKSFEMEIDEFLEKVQFEPTQELKQEQEQIEKENLEKYKKILSLVQQKQDLSAIGIEYGYVRGINCGTGSSYCYKFEQLERAIALKQYPKAIHVRELKGTDSYDHDVSIDDIDLILSAPKIELSEQEKKKYENLLEYCEKDFCIEEYQCSHLRITAFYTEDFYVGNKDFCKKMLEKGVKPDEVLIEDRYTDKSKILTVEEFFEKVNKVPFKTELENGIAKPSTEKETPDLEKWLNLVKLENKKLDLSSLGQENGLVVGFRFDEEEEIGSNAESLIKAGKLPKSIRMGANGKRFYININNIDEILSLPIISTQLTEEEMAKYSNLPSYERKGLELDDFPNQKFYLTDIIMENGQRVFFYDVYQELLKKGIKPIEVKLSNDKNDTLKIEVNEFLEKVKIIKPTEEQNHKYREVANLFDKKLDLSSLGKNYGYLQCIVFNLADFAYNKEEALELLNQNSKPINFALNDSYTGETFECGNIDQLLECPVITQTLSKTELDSYKKIEEHMEQKDDLELGIYAVGREDGTYTIYKSAFQDSIRRNVKPINVTLNNGEKLTIDEYLELLELSKVSTNSQERNVVPSSNETNMTSDEIEALLLGISPEIWANATQEQKVILIKSYQEKQSVMSEESPKTR